MFHPHRIRLSILLVVFMLAATTMLAYSQSENLYLPLLYMRQSDAMQTEPGSQIAEEPTQDEDIGVLDAEVEAGLKVDDSSQEMAAGALLALSGSGYTGLDIDVQNGTGIEIGAGADIGIEIGASKGDGLLIHGAADDGIEVNNATYDGIEVNSSTLDGIQVNNAGDHGVEVVDANDDGLHVTNPTDNGLEVFYEFDTGKTGILVTRGDIKVIEGSFIDDGTTLNVPDYVFEDEYPLMPLRELRRFIEVNKHLPNVPSEADIKADGVDIAAFNMHLLEKVEEQALYILELEARLQAIEHQLGMNR